MTDAHDVFVGDFRMRTSKLLSFKEACHLEDQTKRSLIEPIFDLLGYNTFNPTHANWNTRPMLQVAKVKKLITRCT